MWLRFHKVTMCSDADVYIYIRKNSRQPITIDDAIIGISMEERNVLLVRWYR